MTVPVLAAVTGESWEASLVAGLESAPAGITVVRRCVDLPDLLAAAATGTARAVLLSADLRRLDRDALARLAAARLAVVGLHAPADADAADRLRRLGVRHLLPADAPSADIAAAVRQALAERATEAPGAGYADPLAARPDPPPAADDPTGTASGGGRLVAVWGPTGAPGRSTVALGLAAETAYAGEPTLLVDADTYGGVLAQLLGFLDEAPGLAAAARLANHGQLDRAALDQVAVTAAPRLRVLTGISRPDRWPELRPAAVEQVLDLARGTATVTVVDCGFCLEQDEELAYDTVAPRRNGLTLTVLEAADTVIAVGRADPVGVQRLVRALTELREAVPGVVPRVVLNQVRRGAVGPRPEQQLAEALHRYAGVRDVHAVPEDRAGTDAAVLAGRTLPEAAPDSPARAALAALAADLLGRPGPRRRRPRLGALRLG